MTMFLKLFTIAAILAMALTANLPEGEDVGLVEDACSSTGTGDVRSI